MPNDYFNHVGEAGRLAKGTKARADAVNSLLDKVESGMDKLPTQAQNNRGTRNYAANTGPANQYACSLSHVSGSYATGQKVTLNVNSADANTSTTPTLNVSTIGNTLIKYPDGSAIEVGDISGMCEFRFNGTVWHFVSSGANSAAAAASATAAAASAEAAKNYGDLGGYYVDSGSASQYEINHINPALEPTSYVAGMFIRFIAANQTIGPATVNINSLGAKQLRYSENNTQMNTEGLRAGNLVEAYYDGTYFKVTNIHPKETIFLPVLEGSFGTFDGTYTTQTGQLARSGYLVHAEIQIELSSKGTVTGDIVIDDIALNVDNDYDLYAPIASIGQTTVVSSQFYLVRSGADSLKIMYNDPSTNTRTALQWSDVSNTFSLFTSFTYRTSLAL